MSIAIKTATGRQIRPSAAIYINYRKQLLKLFEGMHQSMLYHVRAAYRREESRIVGDESPARALRRTLNKLFKRWRIQMDDVPQKVAEDFIKTNQRYTQTAMRSALKQAGFTVKMRVSRRQSSILDAAIQQNVSLIKSIAADYFTKVEGSVMRGVMAGRDLGGMVDDLESNYGITRRRAELISRDQTNKACNALTKASYEDLGITRAVWRHNAGGSKSFRISHVKMDGQEFDLLKGMWDSKEGAYIQPGELPFCKCSYSPVLPELNKVRK